MDVISGVTLAKQAYDLLKVIKEGRDSSLVAQAVGDLHEKITELQMLNSELASLYHAEKQVTMKLTDENTKIQMFAAQSAEYEIHKTAAGSIVYRSKTAADSEIGLYYLCAHCYQNRIISILQPSTKTYKSGGYLVHCCHQCESEFKMGKAPPVVYPDVPPLYR